MRSNCEFWSCLFTAFWALKNIYLRRFRNPNPLRLCICQWSPDSFYFEIIDLQIRTKYWAAVSGQSKCHRMTKYIYKCFYVTLFFVFDPGPIFCKVMWLKLTNWLINKSLGRSVITKNRREEFEWVYPIFLSGIIIISGRLPDSHPSA